MISEMEPEDYLLPGIGTLEATSEILRGLLASVTEEQTAWKPAPDRWSIAEVLEHMSHVEGHGFRLRAERMVKEENPVLEVYDQDALAAEGQYSGREVEDSFDHFEEQREDNVAWLTSLPARAISRTAQHQELGTITLGAIAQRVGVPRSGACAASCGNRESVGVFPEYWTVPEVLPGESLI